MTVPKCFCFSHRLPVLGIGYIFQFRLGEYLSPVDFTAPSGSENGSMTQGSESLNGSDDMAQGTFIGQARHRGDGQDVDTSTSSTQLVCLLSMTLQP